MTNFYTEQYRQQFHYSPKANWMNDPNGMVYFKGEYHLFYQHYPSGTTWGPMHWGHAVSKDLVYWEELPIGLFPDEHGMIFSGSAVVDWQNTTGFFEGEPGLVAIFTHHDTHPGTDRVRQRQSLAYSIDNGRNWVKYEGNPVLANDHIIDFRDPKVFWHHETNKWIMVLATDQTITFYTSSNLKDWEFASEFGEGEGSHLAVWECPDLFKLPVDGDSDNDKWVLIVSIGDNVHTKEGSKTQYFIGSFDGKTFVNDNLPESELWLDYGRDNYAGVSWSDIPDEDGRRIYIGWMSNWRYANHVPTVGWRSAMTLPRVLQLCTTEAGIRLIQKPVEELKVLRKESNQGNVVLLKESTNVSINLRASLVEVNVDLDVEHAEEVSLVFQHNEQEKTTILYQVESGKLLVDRTLSGESGFSDSFPAVQEAPLKLKNNLLALQIFVDASSIEVFANEGEVAITSLIYPKTGLEKLHFYSIGGEAKVVSLHWNEMKSIWSR